MSSFADRLVSYADALAALSFVSVSGLGIASGDPDVRCSLALVALPIGVSSFLFAAVATGVIVKLRAWEKEVRSTSDLPKRVLAIAQNLHRARLGIVWVSAILTALVLYALTRDASCTIGAV